MLPKGELESVQQTVSGKIIKLDTAMKEEKEPFDFKAFEEEAIKRLQQGKALEGKDGVLAPLIKRLVEAGLNGEMNAHLTDNKRNNRRNGKTGKQE